MPKKIVIARDFTYRGGEAQTSAVANVGELRRQGVARFVRAHVLRYDEAAVLVNSVNPANLSFKTCVALRLLSRGSAWFEDPRGQRQPVTWPMMAKIARRWLRDYRMTGPLLNDIEREISRLEGAAAEYNRGGASPRLRLDATPIYLRTDLVFGVRAGGSVGHIAGVLNNLSQFAGRPLFLTSDRIPTVAPDIQTTVIEPEPVFLNNSELASLHYNHKFLARAERRPEGRAPAFLYQRYSGNNYCGLALAQKFNVPLVLEYNGSESWVSRNWGEPRVYEAITDRIELLNVQAADLVVVVSRAMRDELVARGVADERVLVNPNGVDPGQYAPNIDGSGVREKYGLQDKLVLGFIGTFGRWHGAEVLAEAFGRLLASEPAYRDRLRLLLIGDGSQMPVVQQQLDEQGIAAQTVLTGLVPQEQGPEHLAACDVLVSPHVPNPDGTPFFGSPTKLFEYMAMGRGIVASRLDQIGEVLEHDRTAWLVEPGDVRSLSAGLRVLVDDEARRRRLGEAAREQALAEHTWRRHTERIIIRLNDLCGQRRAMAA